jgi:hypothetical protein
MKLLNKVKWVLGILMIFVIIIATNLIDRSNFQRVRDAATTIYEDRLVAKDLIFDISNAIHKKEIAAIQADSLFYTKQNIAVNNNIQDLTLRFADTKLTTSEKQILDILIDDLTKLSTLEKNFVNSSYKNTDAILKQILTIDTHLNSLSDIQINEGKKQVALTRKAVNAVELFTQIEIYVLVFLAILIQIIILYNPKDSI